MGSPITRKTIAEQVREDLRGRIKSGEIPAGEKMPSEAECCRTYGVSRATVREAYRLLEQERLLETRHGAGRFVLPGATTMVQGAVNLTQSTLGFLTERGYDPKITVLDVRHTVAESAAAQEFGVSEGDGLLEVERVYLRGNELLTHAVNIFVPERLPKPVAEMDWTTSVAGIFGADGREIRSGYRDISAVQLPSDLEARFEVSGDVAWLKFDGPLFDQQGEVMWWSRELWRGDIRSLRVVNHQDAES
jgi:GntR family transcriptional regulator